MTRRRPDPHAAPVRRARPRWLGFARPAAWAVPLLALGAPPSARAEWPLPDPKASSQALARPEAMPNDPAYPPGRPDGACGGQTELFSFTPACAAAVPPEEAALGAGMAVDRAWLLTRGDPGVVIAILDDGFDLGDPDLGRAVALNPGELPLPLGPSGPAATPDANGDGRFDLFDYTSVTGTAAPRLDAIVDPRLTGRPDGGDANGNGRFDPDDLYRAFANGVDDDGNGLVDDIAGWDFVDEDGSVAPDAPDGAADHDATERRASGTDAALIVAATTNNGVGRAGICPECRVLPIRVGVAGRARPEDVASGLALASAAGAAAAVVRVDAPTPAGWIPAARAHDGPTPDAQPLPWVLHEAGVGPRGLVQNTQLERTVVGGYGPDAPPAVATTFRAPETGGPVRDRVDLRAPSRRDGTAAARLAGVAGLAVAYAAQLAPGRRLGPDELEALLRATRGPALPVGRPPAVLSARGLDARAALDALAAETPIPRAAFERPAGGATLDPDAPIRVEAVVAAPPAAPASWRLEAELGRGALGPSARTLASGRVNAGETRAVAWSGDPSGWFADPVSAPRRPEALRARLRLVVTAEGGAEVSRERSVFVHRDLFSWPGFPFDLGAPVQAGLRRTDDGRVIVAGVDGRIFTFDARGEVAVAGEAPASRRLDQRGEFARDVAGRVPRSALRTAPTFVDPSWWFPTADGPLLTWSPADGSALVQDSLQLEPTWPIPRALLRVEGWGPNGVGLLAVEPGAVRPAQPPGPRIPLPGPTGDLAADAGAAWATTEDAWLRIGPTGSVDVFPLGSGPRVPGREPPAPAVFEDDGRYVVAAFPGRPWQLIGPDGAPVAEALPVAWGEDVVAADLDGDGHVDLAGYTLDPELGPSLTAWSRERDAPLDGFPVPLTDLPAFAPLAADVDGDRRPELIFGVGPHQLAAVGRGGTSAPGFPKLTGDAVVAPPLATDLDGDGFVDLLVATRSGRVYAYRTPGRPASESSWPQARHDDGATGNLATQPEARGATSGGCRSAEGSGPAGLGALAVVAGLALSRRSRRRRGVLTRCAFIGATAWAAGCAAPIPARPSAARTDLHATDRVLKLPAPPGRDRPLSGFAVWQGWSMGWRYNHRLNRAGSLLEQVPCSGEGEAIPAPCRARVTAAAASGSGRDAARVDTYFSVVAARGVRSASAAREVLLEGVEGQLIEVSTHLDIPVDAALIELARDGVVAALLSGFDLASLDSADKLQLLAIRLGTPAFELDRARVPLVVRANLGCGSLECPPRDRVDVSLLVAGTVIVGSPGALALTDIDLAVDYAWDRRVELDPAAARVPLPGDPWTPDRSVFGVRGFEAAADREIHVVDLALAIATGAPDAAFATGSPDEAAPHVTLLVRNWRHKMRNARPPVSWFAYRQAGQVRWTADLVRLDLDQASIARRRWRAEIDWRGESRSALDGAAERARMVNWEVQP